MTNFFDEYKAKAGLINADLEALFKRHGFKITKVRAAIGEGDVRLTVGISANEIKGDDGKVTTPEALRFVRHAGLHGLSPDDLGKTFTVRTGAYKIVGMRDTSGQKPIIVERNGKTFFADAEQICKALHPETARRGKPLGAILGDDL